MLDKIKNFFRLAAGFISQTAKKIPHPASGRISGFFRSWWHLIAAGLAILIFLYYPLGALIVDKIDTNTELDINIAHPEQSASAEMMSYIINRETNEKIWSPNLPFFFPSYFLDNMPNFQLGMMSSVSALAKAMAIRIEPGISDNRELHLKEAARLLQYPGNIWMFSPTNRLMPVPSSHSQYRKARKQLIKYNARLSEGGEVFYRNPADLAFFLKKMNTGLAQSVNSLETQIREYSSNYIDNKADDVFYYNQGRIYGDYLLLRALSVDYKNIIVSNDLYPEWTRMLNAMELASQISPSVVRNGSLGSLTAPNHLSSLAYYTVKSRLLMLNIINKLQQPNTKG